MGFFPFSVAITCSENTCGKLNSILKKLWSIIIGVLLPISVCFRSSLFTTATKKPSPQTATRHWTPCRLFHYQAVSVTCYVRKIPSKIQNTKSIIYLQQPVKMISFTVSLANSHKRKIPHCKTSRNQLVISIAWKSDSSYKKSKPKGRSTHYMIPACCGFKGTWPVWVFHT